MVVWLAIITSVDNLRIKFSKTDSQLCNQFTLGVNKHLIYQKYAGAQLITLILRGDDLSMLKHTYLHKSVRKIIKVAICKHKVDSPLCAC